MKSLTLTLLAGLATVGLIATGCSKDHDLDDYKQEQFQKSYAKTAAVAGTYTGSLKSISTGKTICALQMNLKPNAAAVKSNDQSSASLQPTLSAEISFVGTSDHTLITMDGTYVDTAHLFHAEKGIQQDPSLPTVTINVTGTIGDDGKFNGTISANGYEDEGTTFTLVKNGENVQKLSQELDLSSSGLFSSTSESQSKQYIGTYTDDQGSLDAKLTVASPPRTSEQELADLLVVNSERFLTLNFLFKGNATVSFSSAEYDVASSRLKARETKSIGGSSTSAASFAVNCDHFRFNDDPRYNFNCTYYSSLNGVTAQVIFRSK